jgi:electron transport complex protein RnfD
MFASVPSVFDATTSATWLSTKNSVDGGLLLQILLGTTGSAAVGETCVIALVVSYVYLSVRKIIDWKLPLIIVGSGFVFAILFDGLIKGYDVVGIFSNATAHVLSGGLIFGAVFMATDYATSPNTNVGRIIFGVGIGLFTMLIRCFASYPEGMSFAILVMNIATPLIDKYVYPKPFGSEKKTKEAK